MKNALRLGSLLCLLLIVSCGSGAAKLSSQLDAATPAKYTRYPIVLHHGLFGFDRIFFVDYFYHVPATLTAAGFTVRVTHVPPVNTIAVRASYLAREIDRILAETGAEKVNVIAHSMGGLDARYLISQMGYGDRVASLTTMSTPHEGSPVADAVLALTGANSDLRDSVVRMMTGKSEAEIQSQIQADGPSNTTTFGRPGSTDLFGPIDIQGAIWNLSTKYVGAYFNTANPDDARVYYQSWSGKTQPLLLTRPNVIDPLLRGTCDYIHSVLGGSSAENDGLVTKESSAHGVYRGSLPGSHADMIGQVLGEVPWEYDYKSVYLQVARELAAQGF